MAESRHRGCGDQCCCFPSSSQCYSRGRKMAAGGDDDGGATVFVVVVFLSSLLLFLFLLCFVWVFYLCCPVSVYLAPLSVSFFPFLPRFCSLLPSSLQKISPPSSCLSLCPKNHPAPSVRSPSLLFISRKRGRPPLLCPIMVQGGSGLPYLCRVRWSAVCRAWCPSLLFITLAGYVGARAVVSFMQVGCKERAGKTFQKSSSPLSLHLQGRRSCTVLFKAALCSLFVFFFFEEKENEFGSDPKMSYDNTHAIRVYQHNFRIQFSPI